VVLLGVALLLRRRRLPGPLRLASLALLATGLVWSTYLAAIYYPHYGATLRAVARKLEAGPGVLSRASGPWEKKHIAARE
jgi:hypothetical protein